MSTQTQHPNRAAVRTFIQTLLPSLVLFVVAVPPVVEIVFDEVGKAGVELPSWLFLALTAASVACALVASIAARVMAIPGVEHLLKKIGIGAEPKTEVDATPVADDYEAKH